MVVGVACVVWQKTIPHCCALVGRDDNGGAPWWAADCKMAAALSQISGANSPLGVVCRHTTRRSSNLTCELFPQWT